jgi:iron complex transport system substrate-binding protein
MRPKRLAALAAAIALFPAAACGGDDDEPRADPGRPDRIVSISATATEDLFAVGAGDQVVAVDEFSTHPPEAPRTKLSYIDPNAEAISAHRPDLVVLATESDKVVPALKRLHIPVLSLPPARSLREAYAQILRIGRVTGHAREARQVVARMKQRVDAIVRRAGRRQRELSVYHELSPDYFSATSKSFIGSVYRLLGLRNIADEAEGAGEFPKLSAEYVVQANPDLIVLADTVCCKQRLATLRKRPGLREVDAVRDGHVVEVPDDLASHWGPRIVDFLDRVARALERLGRAQ